MQMTEINPICSQLQHASIPAALRPTLSQMNTLLPTRADCYDVLAKLGLHQYCVYCDKPHIYWQKWLRYYYCTQCQQSFTPTVNMIFYRSRLPLQKWFWLIINMDTIQHLSVRQLARRLHINKTTANKMLFVLQHSKPSQKIILMQLKHKLWSMLAKHN
jgi:transposase-like protein